MVVRAWVLRNDCDKQASVALAALAFFYWVSKLIRDQYKELESSDTNRS